MHPLPFAPVSAERVTAMVELPSAVLAVDRTEGPDPTLVLLYAGIADRRSWAAAVDALDGAFATVAYDRRGFGETEAAPGAHDHVDDLVALLDRLSLERVWLVGNSQGGRVALDTAVAHPERVAGLVLVAPAVTGAPPERPGELPPAVIALWDQLEAAERAGDLATVNELETRVWLDGPQGGEGRVGGDVRRLVLEMNGAALHAPDVGPERERHGTWDRLGEIGVPTLVVWGDLDVPPFPARMPQLVARVRGARGQVMAGTAHLPQLERPAEFAAMVRAFIEG